jgi:hypothetical protein
MDEIDGLSERGGIGEIAELIRKTQIPIICIANERPPKLKPIMNVTLDIKCSRPMKITVATALAKKIPGTTKEQIERLCEESGNDIRSILNTLDFAQGAKERVITTKKDKEDDIFSATFKLMRNKKLTFAEADDLVFTDFSMIPLMVQEAYAAASTDIDELAAAAERLLCSKARGLHVGRLRMVRWRGVRVREQGVSVPEVGIHLDRGRWQSLSRTSLPMLLLPGPRSAPAMLRSPPNAQRPAC